MRNTTNAAATQPFRKHSLTQFVSRFVEPLEGTMGGRKKKFIDKKNSATFQLIARDTSDPSFSQSDRVFVRVDNNPVSFPVADDSAFDDAPDDYYYDDDAGVSGGPLPEDVRREILELGFPDDGYNYLNHLREIKNSGAGAAFYHNPKFKLQHLPRDVKVLLTLCFLKKIELW